jgi:hypothetical protein
MTMARNKAGEQTNSQAAAAQDAAASQTAGSGNEAQVPKEASQDEKSQGTQAQQTVAGEAPAPRLALRITAKPRKGFRRCGLHHPAAAVDHPEGRFSETEIALLKAEPNLVVEDL